MENFTPFPAFLGGLLIGFAALLLLLFNGRIAGISGILDGLLNGSRAELIWRSIFLAGVICGAFIIGQVGAESYPLRTNFPIWLLAIGGFLVGFGTRMGSGCTSGHAVCGIARWSKRSIAATMTFMACGIATVYFVRHVMGLAS